MPFRLDRPADEAEPRPEPPPDDWDEVPPESSTDEPEYDEMRRRRRDFDL